MSDRRTFLLLIGFAGLLGVGLRFVGLLERSVWFDEAMSWRTVILPWSEMVASISDNTHAPLFFCLLKGWIGLFGESLLSLRGFNLAITLVTLVVIERSLAVIPTVSRGMRVVACGLFAASPLQIRLAGEVRMYPLFVLFAIASTWALWRLLHSGRNWRGAGVYSVSVLAMLYTHYFGLFVFAAQVGSVAAVYLFPGLERSKKRAAAGMLVTSWGMIAVGWLPWLPVFLRQRQRVSAGWWTTDFGTGDVWRVISQWVVAEPVIQSQPWLAGVLATFVMSTLIAALVWGHPFGRLAAGVSLLATVLAIGGSCWGTNVMVVRYFGAFQALWLLSLAALVATLPGRGARYICGGAVVLLFSLSHVADVWLRDVWSGPGVRAAVAYLEAERQPGEPMLVDSSFVYFPASFHAQQRDQLRLIDGPTGLPYYGGGPVIRHGDRLTHGELERLSAERVWLLSGRTVQSHPLPSSWDLESQAFFVGTEPFQDLLRVASYVPSRLAISTAEKEPVSQAEVYP